jgi:hypothetical protein
MIGRLEALVQVGLEEFVQKGIGDAFRKVMAPVGIGTLFACLVGCAEDPLSCSL